MTIPIVVHKIFLYCTGSVSIFANGILLILLYHRTSNALGNYRVLLVVFAIADMCISVLHLWYIPMFALFQNGFIYYGYGTLFGRNIFARNSIAIFSTTFYLPFFLIAIHFIYRYLSLVRPSVVKEHFNRFFFACTVYAILYHMFTAYLSNGVTTLGISERFYNYLAEYEHRPLQPVVNVGAVEYVGVNSEIDYRAIFIILAAGAVGGHANAISLYCIYKIVKAFNHRVLEVAARRVHIQLFRALLLQFSIPFFFSYLPFGAIVALPVFGISVGDTGDICALLISLFPALDPILIILSISRFRLTLLQWIDAITGNTAKRNEKNAREMSRVHYSIITRRHTHSTFGLSMYTPP